MAFNSLLLTVILLSISFCNCDEIISVDAKANCGFKCSDTLGCITDLEDSDCQSFGPNFYVTENADICGCCPGCKERKMLRETCDPANEDEICAPGLKCVGNSCQLDKSNCGYIQHQSQSDRDKMKWLPKCLPDGTYAPVQCKGDKVTYGRCFCTSPTGQRIFGWMWYKDADKMTCACSRRRYELESKKLSVTLHCSDDGSYEELQCDAEVCWCADKQTGEPDLGVPVVPESMIQFLPCYNASVLGERYLRQCESQAHAQEQMRQLLDERGTSEATLLSVFCDYDGTYGPVQLDKGIAFCSWRDKTKIKAFAAESGAAVASINCNCARDHMIYQAEDLEMSLLCEGNGNYKFLQEHDAQYFCVDRDGYAITELQPKGDQLQCEPILDLYP